MVEPSAAESKTASGLYLPETAQERPAQGKVLAIGADLVTENGKIMVCPVKVGEKVDGATLKNITPDKATLDYKGNIIELWVNH